MKEQKKSRFIVSGIIVLLIGYGINQLVQSNKQKKQIIIHDMMIGVCAKNKASVNSNKLRSDYTNTFDIMLTKAIGDFFPAIDPNRSLFINLSYEKVISEANIINYDYISDSFSLSFSRSFRLN